MQELLETYPIIGQVGPWIGGAIGGSLLLLLRNRRPLLRYDVSHQQIGMTAEDEIHGKVEVTYRGNVVHNLYLSQIALTNSSFKDLEDLEFKTYRGHDNIELLTEKTHIDGTIDPIELTEDYFDRIVANSEYESEVIEAGTAEEPEIQQRLQADYRFRHGQRWYKVPVLNRGQTVKITYVVRAAPNSSPVIYLSCQSKGVRIKEKPYRHAVTHLWGVPIFQAAWTGIFTAFVVYGLVVWQITSLWIAALICTVFGVLANVPGAILVRIYTWLRSKLIG